MLNKDKLKKQGYRIMDSSKKLPTAKAERLAKLKEILPALVNSDGLLDANVLKELLGIENVSLTGQGYGLNFAGKGLARIKADEPTQKELQVVAKQSKNFDTTENAIIRGDNLDVLKILRQNYEGKVKMIYIDPPYNTDSDEFLYKDSFKEKEEELIEKYAMDEEAVNFFENLFGTKSHSGWLYFMYPRLKLARDLLTEDGVMFISIDDNEQANLKLICDEIFGEKSFVGEIVVQTNPRGRQLDKYLAKTCEYILVYVKDTNFTSLFEVPKSAWIMQQYDKKDDIGAYRLLELRNRGSAQFNRKTRPNLYFPIYVNPITGAVSLEKREPFLAEALPLNSKNEDGCWTWGKKRVLAELDKLLGRQTKAGAWRIFRKDYIPEAGATSKEKTLWLDTNVNHEVGRERVTSLYQFSAFDFPKSHQLIAKTLKIGCGNNDIILDFFAGSGTTADAVMQMNAEDGTNRKFILVQSDEKIDAKNSKPAYDFCIASQLEPVISSICIERVHRAGEKIKKEWEQKEANKLLDKKPLPDIGYKVFSLVDRPRLAEEPSGQLIIQNPRLQTIDTLYNMMGSSGEALLSSPIEEIEADRLYKIKHSIYVLGPCKTKLETYVHHQIYIDGYAKIELENWLNMLGIHKENVRIIY